ncbi:hypothetical protein, partial [Caballeronia sp. J97]|uniref:hypothetical protein n=1 Tax=Caballeronia sp. J97 TaxID=2805429 RepID=UPI002AB20B72
MIASSRVIAFQIILVRQQSHYKIEISARSIAMIDYAITSLHAEILRKEKWRSPFRGCAIVPANPD